MVLKRNIVGFIVGVIFLVISVSTMIAASLSTITPIGKCSMIHINGTYTIPKNESSNYFIVVSGNYCKITSHYIIIINNKTQPAWNCIPTNATRLYGGETIYSRNLTVKVCSTLLNRVFFGISITTAGIGTLICCLYATQPQQNKENNR